MSDHAFERDLMRLRTGWRVAASIPSPQLTLRRDTVMAMNDETTAPESSLLRDLPALIRAGFNKVAEEHDIQPAVLLGEMAASVATAIAARRAAKRGDVAKTVLYASMLIRQHAAYHHRAVRAAVVRAHSETMAARKISLRTHVKGAM